MAVDWTDTRARTTPRHAPAPVVTIAVPAGVDGAGTRLPASGTPPARPQTAHADPVERTGRRRQPVTRAACLVGGLYLAMAALAIVTSALVYSLLPLDERMRMLAGYAIGLFFTVATAVTLIRVVAGLCRARQDAVDEIARLARVDGVTGLPNRLLAGERIADALGAGADGTPHAAPSPFALLFIDLDHFKDVNDSLGHGAGDELLRLVAARITQTVRARDVVARLGGDEFLVLLEAPTPRSDAHATAERIRAALAQPFEMAGNRLFVSASIGVTVAPEDGTDVDALVRHADIAMYAAKHDGRNAVRSFESAMREAVSARAELHGALHQALQRGEFFVVYQPITDPVGRMTGVEALVRWDRPGTGTVMPGEFLSVAADAGIALQLDRWVMAHAIGEFAAWRRDARVPEGVRLSVNVSAEQFVEHDFADWVVSTLRVHGLPAERLEIELTERTLMRDRKSAMDCLLALVRAGIHLAIDDFGTGYSSLSYLRTLPLRTVKLDRSFVAGITGSASDRTLVRGMISLVRGLGFHVLAEGVETVEQLDVLRTLGCDEIQGFLLGLPAAQVPAPMLPAAR